MMSWIRSVLGRDDVSTEAKETAKEEAERNRVRRARVNYNGLAARTAASVGSF